MRMLTGHEASTLLRVRPETIGAMIRRGALDGFVNGKTTRVTLASIERLVGARVEVVGATLGASTGRGVSERQSTSN